MNSLKSLICIVIVMLCITAAKSAPQLRDVQNVQAINPDAEQLDGSDLEKDLKPAESYGFGYYSGSGYGGGGYGGYGYNRFHSYPSYYSYGYPYYGVGLGSYGYAYPYYGSYGGIHGHYY